MAKGKLYQDAGSARWLIKPAAANYIGVSVAGFDRLIALGLIKKHYASPGRTCFDKLQLDAYMMNSRAPRRLKSASTTTSASAEPTGALAGRAV